MPTISIARYHAVGDGLNDNSLAFRDAFSAVKASGGGTVVIPPGIWMTGPIEIPSHCTVELEKDAVLRFIPQFERYTAIWTRWEGVECYAMHPCIFARDAVDITICGEGTVDGNGSFWWTYRKTVKSRKDRGPTSELEQSFARLNPNYREQPGGGGGRNSQFLAPPLIQFLRCTDVVMKDITVMNSPFWTIHPVYTDNIRIERVSVLNPYEAPNTDGIDIDSCSRVYIADCYIDVGDDAIALKSGSGYDGLSVAKSTRNVMIERCTVKRAHGGIVIGSETAGGVYNVTATDCMFECTDRGIRIKTRRGRGGLIRNLAFSNCTMIDNLCPIAVNMYYHCGILEHEKARAFSLDKQRVEHDTPMIENIVVRGVKATGSKASAGFFAGLPEAPIQNLVVENCHLGCDMSSTVDADESEMYEGLPKGRSKNVRIRNCSNAAFRSVAVDGPEEPFTIEDAIRIVIE